MKGGAVSSKRYLTQSRGQNSGAHVISYEDETVSEKADKEISHYSVIDAAAAIAAERVDSKQQARTRILIGFASLFGAALIYIA